MADQKVKVYDGSTWQDIESNAKLPVAASDGKSQVDGKDGLIIIENLEDNGEIGLHWDTKAGSRWRTVVEEGLAGGQMTFYDSSNEAVFTLKQDGTVLIEQGTDPSETGNQVATAAYVRLLMNTFPIVDTEQIIKIDSGTDNENLANPNIKKIYFGIGGQSVDNPDRILTISIDTDADPDAKHITAHEDYTPTDPQDLVTLSYFQANSSTGDFLPLAGGTMDVAAHIFMPSGNTVSPQLQVGCQEDLTGTTQGANFNLIVSGNKKEAPGNKNAIVTVWSPNDTGIAYMKWAINEDATEYWNVLANSISTSEGYEGNRFWQVQSGEGGAFITCIDNTDSSVRQVTINQTYLCTPRLGTVDRAEGDAELRMLNSSMVVAAGDDLGDDPDTGDSLGFSELENKVLLGSYKYKANISDEGKVRYASLSTRNGSLAAMPPSVSNQNTVALDIYEQQNHADSCYSIQWNAAAGAFNAPCAEIKNVRQGAGANFHLTFSAMAANELNEYLTLGDNQILANEEYVPTEDNSLVTKGWAAANTRLPAMGDDAGGNDFRVEYLDRNHNAEGVQEIDPANPSCIRLGVFGGLATAGLVRAGSFLVDGLGRLLASQSGYNSSQKPSRSMMMGLYSATDIGNTRTGVALRGYHYGDIPEGSTQQGVSYTYGFYSSPNYQNLKVTTSIDYLAVGPSGNLDPESGESLSNGSVQTAVGFSIPSNFGSYIKHPLGGNPITQGFRSDLALQDNKNQYAIFVNGTAPSRFNSNIQLTSNCAITTAVDTDAKLTISGTQAQIESNGYTPLRLKNLASNGACIVSESAYGSYTFGTTGLGWSIITSANDYRLSVTDDETRFYKTDGSTTQLLINDTMIRASSDYEPSGDYDLATKKYVDDNLGNGGGSANISAGTPANEVDADAVAGDMMFDENYLWLKTSTVWKKIPLLGFSSTPTGPTLQLTQEQYDAIPVKDDNTLYVIVG